MGPSGSGKSTLLHCLAGLDRLTEGQVFLGDIDISSLSEKELTKVRRDRIGFIFQTYNLIPTLTALENITLPAALAGRDEDKQWLDQIIDTVRLRERLTHRPSELSGGQQQRVAVARAPARRSSTSCGARSTTSNRPSSWSPTIRPPRPTPTGSCSSPTGRSWTSCATRAPMRSSTRCAGSETDPCGR